jgi:hypothetical protein
MMLGILPGESYSGICALADLSVYVLIIPTDVEEVELDPNGNEIEEDEDDEITEQARNPRTLN